MNQEHGENGSVDRAAQMTSGKKTAPGLRSHSPYTHAVRRRGEFDTHSCLCYILTAVGDLVRRLKPLGKGPQMERGDCTAFPAFDGPGEPRARGGQIIVRNR